MSELKVPTVALSAEVTCVDGRTFVGRIFVPAAASHHTGPMRPDEWLNEPSPFFPFLPDEGESYFILSKHQVLVISTTWQDEPALGEGFPSRRVAVECGDRRLEGILRIEMPAGRSRVLDYLNGPEPFLIVHEADRVHLVHKQRITRLIELREA